MAGLKELRTRIESIKSTQKITSAMKMVAAARLRRAQDVLGKSKSYYDGLLTITGRLYKQILNKEKQTGIRYNYPLIMQEKERSENYLLVVFSSDRGLCGSYNSYILKETLRRTTELQQTGKKVKVLCVGKKLGDALRHRKPELIADVLTGVGGKGVSYKEIEYLVEPLIAAYMVDEFDVCEVIYTHFNSAINREVKSYRLLPFVPEVNVEDSRYDDIAGDAFFEYDAPEEKVFTDVLFMLAIAEVFRMFLNSQASEQGARMTSMDNATRNANDMVDKLTLKYNRLRQGAITTELTEIISGAEAL